MKKNNNNQFIIRNVLPRDLRDVYQLACHLDSYNLPADKPRLERLIKHSQLSFQQKLKDSTQARYLFVLEDQYLSRVVGCSLVIAKHGTLGLPHLYLSSYSEKRYSKTLQKSVEHKCLRLGANEDGPTEVGGLVLLPSYRKHPQKLGKWLSFVRFLYIAAHKYLFQPHILAEFLPVFIQKDKSLFWEYFGQKFTGFTYHQADRLSIDNKEFILSLFPRGTIYRDFFPKQINQYLGEVGDPTKPAARLLQKIGFQYLHQIEPFDGGPYYGALTNYITLIRQSQCLPCLIQNASSSGASGTSAVLMNETSQGLRSIQSFAQKRKEKLILSLQEAQKLNAQNNQKIWRVPIK